MKKFTSIFTAMFVISAFCFFCHDNSACEYSNNHYTREAIVIATEANDVIVKDEFGNIWAFNGDSYSIGDNVTLEMSSNGTIDIKDDTIENVSSSII